MSRRHLVVVPSPKKLIQGSSWGELHRGTVNSASVEYRSTKHLADCHLDAVAICEFGCRYCSSNNGLLYQFRKQSWGDAIEATLGERASPDDDPYLHLVYDRVVEHLERELHGKRRTYGAGKTLVYSQLTDGFGPWLVAQGYTRRILELVLQYTSFRIRVLTKSAVVGHSDWIEFFLKHRDRFVVGLSTGTMDDDWAKSVEIGTSAPSARLRALRALQDAGVPTYGMLCPIFPDAAGNLHELLDAIRPEKCETVWAEPFNDRNNWRVVRSGYPVGSPGYEWFTRVYERGNVEAWSRYATYLWVQLQLRSQSEGWLEKLRYMLYEGDEHFGIIARHKRAYCDMRGLLLQNVSDKRGQSSNPHIEDMRRLIRDVTVFDRLTSPYSAFDEEAPQRAPMVLSRLMTDDAVK